MNYHCRMHHQLNSQDPLGDSHQIPCPVWVLWDQPTARAAHKKKNTALQVLHIYVAKTMRQWPGSWFRWKGALAPHVQVGHPFIVKKMWQRSPPSTRQNQVSQFFEPDATTAWGGGRLRNQWVRWTEGNSEICWGPEAEVRWEQSQALVLESGVLFSTASAHPFHYLVKLFDHFNQTSMRLFG